MEALKTATSVLQQDGSEFGSGKQCSIALSLLEPSRSTGDPCLQFKVASSDCQSYVVGRKLLRSHKQVSLSLVCDLVPRPPSLRLYLANTGSRRPGYKVIT